MRKKFKVAPFVFASAIGLILASPVLSQTMDANSVIMEDRADAIRGSDPFEIVSAKLASYGFRVTQSLVVDTKDYTLPFEPDCKKLTPEQVIAARKVPLSHVEVIADGGRLSFSSWTCTAEVIALIAFKADITCVPTAPSGATYVIPGSNLGQKGYSYCHLRPDM